MAAVISATFELDLKKFMDSLNQVASESEASAEKVKTAFANATTGLGDKQIKIGVAKENVEAELDSVQKKLDSIKPPANAENVGKTMKDKILSGFKGIDDSMKGMLGGVLAVAGGGILAKGIEGVVGSFGGLIEKGKGSLQATQNLEVAFATAGLKGEALDRKSVV